MCRANRGLFFEVLLAAVAVVNGAPLANVVAGKTESADVTRLTRTYYSKFFLRYSPDGSHIVYSRHHRNLRGSNRILVGLRIIQANGSNDRALLSEYDSQVQIQEHASFSPNGKQLVISGGGNDTGNSSKDAFVCNIDDEFQATNLKKIIPGRSVNIGEEPCFSPDGKQIAYVTTSEQLWTIDADGKNKSLVVQVDGQYCHQPHWSPDAEWIAFSSDRDGNVEIYKVRPDGTDLTRLTRHDRFDCRPRWSRDGEWILFTSNRSGNHDLFLMRDDGSEVRQLTTHRAMDDHAAWAPDGKSIAFVSMRDGGFDVYRLRIPEDVQIGDAPTIRSTPPPIGFGDLVVHFDFDDVSSGNRLRSLAGRSSLTLFGARVVKQNDRGSLSFDGKKDYASLGNSAPLRIAGPLTISLWVRPDSAGGNGYLISKHGWNIYLGSDLVPRFETRTANNSAWDTLAAESPLSAGEWSFVTAVFDPKAKKLAVFVNGNRSAQRDRNDGAIGAVTSYPLEIGHYGVSRTQKFHGRIDELRVYRRALTDIEITKEYDHQGRYVRGVD